MSKNVQNHPINFVTENGLIPTKPKKWRVFHFHFWKNVQKCPTTFVTENGLAEFAAIFSFPFFSKLATFFQQLSQTNINNILSTIYKK
jgi:hypothetical protein